MPRLMSEEEAARAAAIAAMGYRLAAAGPRTRQRLRDRQGWQDDSWSNDTPPAYWSAAPAQTAFSWRDLISALRRSTLLASAAACGFGLVLIGLNMTLAQRATEHTGRGNVPLSIVDLANATLATPADQTDVTTLAAPSALSFAAVLPPAATRESLSGVILPPPAPIEFVTTLSNPPAASFAAAAGPHQPEAATPEISQAAPAYHDERLLVARDSGSSAKLAPAPKSHPDLLDHRALAAARTHAGSQSLAARAEASMKLRPGHTHGLRPEWRPAPVLLARADRPAKAADFDVPRWLAAEKAPPPPRVLIMSPPPRMLTHPTESTPPAAPAASPPAQAIASATPPPSRRLPPLVVASSGYPDPAAATPPAYRPYYYPQSYGYGAPYYPQGYGGYYGNAAQ